MMLRTCFRTTASPLKVCGRSHSQTVGPSETRRLRTAANTAGSASPSRLSNAERSRSSSGAAAFLAAASMGVWLGSIETILAEISTRFRRRVAIGLLATGALGFNVANGMFQHFALLGAGLAHRAAQI